MEFGRSAFAYVLLVKHCLYVYTYCLNLGQELWKAELREVVLLPQGNFNSFWQLSKFLEYKATHCFYF